MDALETPRLDFFPIVAPASATTEAPASEQISGDFANALAQVPNSPIIVTPAVQDNLAVTEPTASATDLTVTPVSDWSTSISWVTSLFPNVDDPAPIAPNEAGPVELGNDLPVSEPEVPPVSVQDHPASGPVLTTLLTQHWPASVPESVSAFSIQSSAVNPGDDFSTPVSFGLAVVNAALPAHLTVTAPQSAANPEPVGEDDARSSIEPTPTTHDENPLLVSTNLTPPFVMFTLPAMSSAVDTTEPRPLPSTTDVVSAAVAPGSTDSTSGTTEPVPVIAPRDGIQRAPHTPRVPMPMNAASPPALPPVVPANTVRDTVVRVKSASTETHPEIASAPTVGATHIPTPIKTTPIKTARSETPQSPVQSADASDVMNSLPPAATTSATPVLTATIANTSAAVATPTPQPAVPRAGKPAPIKRDTDDQPTATKVAEPSSTTALQPLVAAMTPVVPTPVNVPVDTVATVTPKSMTPAAVSPSISEKLPTVGEIEPQVAAIPESESTPVPISPDTSANKPKTKNVVAADDTTISVAADGTAVPSPKLGRAQPQSDVPAARTNLPTDALPAAKDGRDIAKPSAANPRDSDTVTTPPQRVDVTRSSPSALDFGDPVPIHPAAQLVQRLGDAIGFAQESGQELSIRVTPPQFGPIVVEVRMHDGALTARVETHSTIAHEAITEHLPQLQESLTARGATLDRIEIIPVENRVPTDRHTATDDAPTPRESSGNGWMSSGASGGQGTDAQDQQRRRTPRPSPLPTAEPAAVASPTTTSRPMELQGLNVRV